MSGSVRLALILLATVFALYLGYKIVAGLISAVLSLVVPILIVGGIAIALYYAVGRKALGGGRRTLP